MSFVQQQQTCPDRSGVNERVALWLTAKVGTMWAAYAFTALALVSAPAALTSGSLVVIVAWLSQALLQLVLLPVIMVGQDVQSRATETAILDTHTLAVAEHEATRELLADLHAVVKATHAAVTTPTAAGD